MLASSVHGWTDSNNKEDSQEANTINFSFDQFTSILVMCSMLDSHW